MTDRNNNSGQPVVRPVELLIGTRSIANFLKVGLRKVRDFEKKGAPIVRDEAGIMRAEKAELWQWVKEAR